MTTKLEQEIQAKKKRLEELKKIQINLIEKERLDVEEAKIKASIGKAESRAAHPKLFGFARAYSNFWGKLFKGFGRGVKRAGNALEKSDEWVAKEKAKEAELLKKESVNKKQVSALEEAQHGLD